MSLLVKALRHLEARPSAEPPRTVEAAPIVEMLAGFDPTPSSEAFACTEATAIVDAAMGDAATATIAVPPDLAEPEPLDETAFSPAWTADEWTAAEASPDTIAVLSALLDEMLASPVGETPEPDESLQAEPLVPIAGLPFGDPLPFSPIAAELPAFDLPIAELPDVERPDAVPTVEDATIGLAPSADSAMTIEPTDSLPSLAEPFFVKPAVAELHRIELPIAEPILAEPPTADITAAASIVEGPSVETLPAEDSAAAIESIDPIAAVPPPSAIESIVGREYQALSDRLVNDLRDRLPAALMFAPVESGADDLLLPLAGALTQRQPGRVLIVEAGGNESRWPARLGIDVVAGLTDVLKSQSAWREAVRPTMVPRVDLLARGADAWPTSAAVASAAESLLSELKAVYGMVLIAAPEAAGPLAAMLAPACDAAVLILDLGSTPRRLASRAKRWLELHGVRVIGCIVRAAA